jgi:hypothetical protein
MDSRRDRIVRAFQKSKQLTRSGSSCTSLELAPTTELAPARAGVRLAPKPVRQHSCAVRCYHEGMGLDERAFFNEKPESRQGRYQCPKCRRTADYSIRWVRRAKKDRLPPGADEADRLKFAKLRDQLAGLPNDEDLEREIAAASGQEEEPPVEQKPALPARFTRKSTGWK